MHSVFMDFGLVWRGILVSSGAAQTSVVYSVCSLNIWWLLMEEHIMHIQVLPI
jgi:hypothetical protein